MVTDYQPNTISFSESHWPAPLMKPPLRRSRRGAHTPQPPSTSDSPPKMRTLRAKIVRPPPGRYHTLWHACHAPGPPPPPTTWRHSGARTPQPPSSGASPPEPRTPRALARLAPVRAAGTHVKLTVIAAMMGDMAVEGLVLCQPCQAPGPPDWIKGQPPGWRPLKICPVGR